MLVVEVTDGENTGASTPVMVVYKTEAPVVTFTSPNEDSVYNNNTAACLESVVDCVTTVTADVVNGDNANADLVISCDGTTTTTSTTVSEGVAEWSVSLPDQSTCSLTALVEDEAGLQASAGPIELTIDRVAPVVLSIPSPADDLLQFYNDENSSKPGMQKTISVEVSGVETGQTIAVTLSDENGNLLITKNIFITSGVADGESAVISAGQFDFPDGTVLVNATTMMPLEMKLNPSVGFY
jgi:hypothetical protein